MINGSADIVSLAFNPDKDLIKLRPPLDVVASDFLLLIGKFVREVRPEAVSQEPDGLMADVDASFVQQSLNLEQR